MQFVLETPDNILQEKNLVQCCFNTLRTTLQRSKPFSERLQTTLHWKRSSAMLSEQHLVTFVDFYFEPVNFLIKTNTCKCGTNIIQNLPTLHKENLRLTLNKKTKLYGTSA